MEINYSLLVVYTVGTLCGLVFGVRWGFVRGTHYGVTKTIGTLSVTLAHQISTLNQIAETLREHNKSD